MPRSVTAPTSRLVGSRLDFVDYGSHVSGRASTLRWDVLRAEELSGPLRSEWNAIRSRSVSFRSPFFSPSFIEQMAAHIPSVEIGVATQDGKAVAIFPFQRQQGTIAKPVGLGINDGHGMISIAGQGPSLHEMMDHCGVNSFPYHAAPCDAVGVAETEFGKCKSYLSDLTVDSRGYDYYLREHSNTIDKQAQKTRRMVRQLGPLKFEFDCRDVRVLDRLIELKCEQYRRTHTFCILGVPWIQRLLRDMHCNRDAPTRGILNALFAGDQPVAMHFGIWEGDLLHYWFPVFDPNYSYGSPGTQLFLDVAREARTLGISAIDMGYGEQAYKSKLTNVVTEMSYGLADNHPLRRFWHRQKLALRAGWKKLGFRERIKPIARKLLPDFGKGNYEV